MTTRECAATRYSPRPCSETPPDFDVVYRTPSGDTVLARHPACWQHGLAEIDRHEASAGAARVEMEGPIR